MDRSHPRSRTKGESAVREFVVKDWKSSGPLRLMRDPQEEPEESGKGRPAVRTYAIPPTGKETAEPVAPAAPTAPATEPKSSEPAAPLAHQPVPATDPRPTLAAASPIPQPSRKEGSRKPSPPRKQGERVFIVHYDGSYVGFYQAEDELKPQEAFLCVARELSSQGPFDPEKLTLHKPVLIKSARPPKGMHFVRGKLCKVTAPAQEVPETPASTGAPEPPQPESPSEHVDLPVVCLDEPA
jgi:hypothetical protein